MLNDCKLTECKRLLEQGVADLQLNLDQQQINQLINYLELLSKWNAVYNLTSVRDPLEMVKQHLLDSLSAASAFRRADRILDVGSGGGLPGIVLAIVYPDKQFTLIDTVHKKTAFLKQVKAELGLNNVMVCTGRVQELEEQLGVPTSFDVITSRAFTELANFVNWAGYLLASEGHMVALKGQLPQREIDQLPKQWRVSEIQTVQVPGLDVQRHLIWLVRN